MTQALYAHMNNNNKKSLIGHFTGPGWGSGASGGFNQFESDKTIFKSLKKKKNHEVKQTTSYPGDHASVMLSTAKLSGVRRLCSLLFRF
jgi:hypothetical protein